jgi:hypothetical protein
VSWRAFCVLALAACAAPTGQAAMFSRAGEGLAAAEGRTGDLKLACSPDDSQVWLDGVPMGSCLEYSGRRGLSLGQRMRKVEVRREGYRSFETFVEPDGTRAALTVTLAPSNTGGGP